MGLCSARPSSGRPESKSGEASSQAAIARQEGVTRARVAQVMGLLRLAPEIQEHVLPLPDMVLQPAITELALRPIAQPDATLSASRLAGFPWPAMNDMSQILTRGAGLRQG